MLIRILGIVVVLLASCGLGFRISYELSYRIEDLQQIKRVLVMLRGEIKYANTPLTEAWSSIAFRVPEPWKSFLKELTEAMEAYDGDTFASIFQKMQKKYLDGTSLLSKDINRLADFGANLGYLDKEMQLGSIDLYLEELEGEMKEAEGKAEKNSKLYRIMGMAVGVLILLIIL
ncbi:MAG: stage III sporulation protein AB [Lachnospiraceae bacterium]|nr:stage III sporulation protein AB [Lachnospiraceae bacterium]